ncbi:MAG: cardiolipin synthase [Bacteroidales bacterium]
MAVLAIIQKLIYLIYFVILVFVCLRIIFDTQDTSKALAYILFAIFVPIVGIAFYFTVGINYRKRKLYTKKLKHEEKLKGFSYGDESWTIANKKIFDDIGLKNYKPLAKLLSNSHVGTITVNNDVELLINGEEKFKSVFEAIREAKNHIHIEYFIVEDDYVGNQLAELLIQKASEGVEVRFIYDDYGSRGIRKRYAQRLAQNGVDIHPFYKIKLLLLANRLNYRNHRKIIVVDGKIGFVGGINVSDRYINYTDEQIDKMGVYAKKNKKKKYWRDTHIKISGESVYALQYVFLCDWNFCAKQDLKANLKFFPKINKQYNNGKAVQMVAGGPDSELPLTELSILRTINNAKTEILITTPYFIPSKSVLEALYSAALSGVKIKLLVPKCSDTLIVDVAAKSYYNELLRANAEIYLYIKGMIHAKTLVSDKELSIVGTANMDIRSFDLNFEINAMIYNKTFSEQLADIFYKDLNDAEKIDVVAWNKKPFYKKLWSKLLSLFSPLL